MFSSDRAPDEMPSAGCIATVHARPDSNGCVLAVHIVAIQVHPASSRSVSRAHETTGCNTSGIQLAPGTHGIGFRNHHFKPSSTRIARTCTNQPSISRPKNGPRAIAASAAEADSSETVLARASGP